MKMSLYLGCFVPSGHLFYCQVPMNCSREARFASISRPSTNTSSQTCLNKELFRNWCKHFGVGICCMQATMHLHSASLLLVHRKYEVTCLPSKLWLVNPHPTLQPINFSRRRALEWKRTALHSAEQCESSVGNRYPTASVNCEVKPASDETSC